MVNISISEDSDALRTYETSQVIARHVLRVALRYDISDKFLNSYMTKCTCSQGCNMMITFVSFHFCQNEM